MKDWRRVKRLEALGGDWYTTSIPLQIDVAVRRIDVLCPGCTESFVVCETAEGPHGNSWLVGKAVKIGCELPSCATEVEICTAPEGQGD